MASQSQKLKEEGNKKFSEKNYREAISLYSQAIALAGSENPATYYGNRSAAWFMLKEYQQCIRDCNTATSLDPSIMKCYQRASKASTQLGDLEMASEKIEQALKLDPNNQESKEHAELIQSVKKYLAKADSALNSGNYAEARSLYNNLESHMSASNTLTLKQAMCELKLGNYSQTLRLTLLVIKSDAQNTEAYYIRGLAMYATDNYDQAIKHFQEVLRLDPDHQGASSQLKRVRALVRSIKAAREAKDVRNFEEAIQNYDEAISSDPENKQLVGTLTTERAECYLRLGKHDKCIEDCTNVIKMFPDLAKAYVTRSTCYKALEKYEEALADIEKATELEPNNTLYFDKLETAKFDLRKSKRVDYYALLGVSKVASELEIKQAYKQKALEWHPDKHSQSEEDRKKAEVIFKQIGEAYDVLSDSFKKELYDKGYDLEAIKEKEEIAKRRAAYHGHPH